jgi:hypothetical protein
VQVNDRTKRAAALTDAARKTLQNWFME